MIHALRTSCRLDRRLVGLTFLTVVLAVTTLAAPARPSFLFILTDDQRFDTLGCTGNKLIQTPNLDRLAMRGVRFQNHFVTTPICCVSRASLFTGQYQRRHRIGDFATPLTAQQWAASYPAQLRAAGYRTGFIGKLGVGDGTAVAALAGEFDFWRGQPGQAGEWFIDPDDPQQRHMTARMGEEALEFLDGCVPDQPFCLSLSFNAPHARDGKPRPFEPDRRDEAFYSDLRIPPPVSATPEDFARLTEFVQQSEARRRWEPRFSTDEKYQATMKDYYRLITGIDREVGRLVERLASRGLADHTVILFTSDNGWLAGEHGLADKWFIYEESIRVPLVIVDPRMPPSARGLTVDVITLNLDLAPTMLALAGLPVPASIQGRSLEPFVQGDRPVGWRTDFFFEHHFGPHIIPPSEGIRNEHWTYVRWLPPNPEIEELYDLRRDPLQRTNLAANPAQATLLHSLRLRSLQAAEDLK